MTTIASPRSDKTRAKNVAGLPAIPPVIEITDQDIAVRAFELYCARGCEDGHDLEDWLQAESELRSQPGAAVQES